MKKTAFFICLSAAVMTALWLFGIYFWPHEKVTDLPVKHDAAVLKSDFFHPHYKLFAGKTTFIFNASVLDLRIITVHGSEYPGIRELSKHKFVVSISEILFFKRIEIDLAKREPGAILKMRTVHQSLVKFPDILFQFSSLFILFCLLLTGVGIIIKIVFHRQENLVSFLQLGAFFLLLLILLFFLFALTHFSQIMKMISDYLGDIGKRRVSWNRILITNLIVAVFVSLAYWLFTRIRSLKSWIPLLLLIVLILAITPDFNTHSLGNYDHYSLIINQKVLQIPELLSLLQVKAVLKLKQALLGNNDIQGAFLISSKMMGVLLVLGLFFLLQSARKVALSQQARILVLLAALPAMLFFTGYPELEYYSYPLLIFGYALVLKYLSFDEGLGFLFAATLLIILSGLVHATGFFSLPVIFILPFLKELKQTAADRKFVFYLRHFGVILSAVLSIALLLLILFKLIFPRWRVVFLAAEMLVDSSDKRFIGIFPTYDYGYRVAFLTVDYFLTRSWIILLACPAMLLTLLSRWGKGISLHEKDLTLFMLAVSQLVLFLFVSFDLGIHDFSLYVPSLLMTNLFFLVPFAARLELVRRCWREMALVFLFAFVNTTPLLLYLTCR